MTGSELARRVQAPMTAARGLALHGVAILTLALSGCVTTLFESPPGITTTSCDKRWVGNWEVRQEHPASPSKDTLTVSISPECKTLTAIEDGKTQHDTDHVILAFASIKDIAIAALKLDPMATDAQAKPLDWDVGYHYFSYVVAADEIRLRQVDDDRVAQLLIEGKLVGRTEKITRYPGANQPADGATLHNFVAGSAQDMANALTTYALFSDKNAIILKRIAGKATATDANKVQASKSKKP
jgi:hypothetical protein